MKNQNAEIRNAKNLQNAKNENADAKNLQSLIEGIEIKNPASQRKNALGYKYPDGWGKDEINGLKGKGFRNQRRNSLQRISNGFFFGIQSQNAEMQNKYFEEWKKEYHSFYSLNDFSLDSIRLGKKWDDKEIQFFERFLKGMQIMQGK